MINDVVREIPLPSSERVEYMVRVRETEHPGMYYLEVTDSAFGDSMTLRGLYRDLDDAVARAKRVVLW